MKKYIRIFSLISLALCFLFVLSGAFGHVAASTGGDRAKNKNYLFVGLDDAAENTDVLCIANLNYKTGKISLLQIPRDTFCDLNAYPNKINQIYARANLKDKSGIGTLKSFLEKQFSLAFDGYIAISTQTLVEFVDELGGVTVELSEDVTLKNGENIVLSLREGNNLLDGRSALLFVRHRAGYTGGDIERLDMQKVFFKGLLKTLAEKSKGKALKAITTISRKAITDISFFDMLELFGNRKRIAGMSLVSRTLPGEAIKGTNGLWYYVVKREAAILLLREMYGHDYTYFDKDCLFLNRESKEFKQIYFKK